MYKPNGISDAQHRKGNDITVTSEHDMQVFRTNFESGHEVFFSHLSLLMNSSGQIRIATYGPLRLLHGLRLLRRQRVLGRVIILQPM